MKKLLVLFVVFISIVACNKSSKQRTVMPGPARMEFDETSFDFNDINMSDPVQKHTYHFVNMGSEPLVITNIKTSCHCVKVDDYPKEPVGPGEEGDIDITFNARESIPGYVNKSLLVYNNTKKSPIRLKVHAFIKE